MKRDAEAVQCDQLDAKALQRIGDEHARQQAENRDLVELINVQPRAQSLAIHMR